MSKCIPPLPRTPQSTAPPRRRPLHPFLDPSRQIRHKAAPPSSGDAAFVFTPAAVVHVPTLAYRHRRSRHGWAPVIGPLDRRGRALAKPHRPVHRRSPGLARASATRRAGSELGLHQLGRRSGGAGRLARHRPLRRADRRRRGAGARRGRGGADAGKPVVTANKALLAKHGAALASWPRRNGARSPSKPRSPAAFRSSRRCARASPAIRSSASTASSTAPAITSCRGWRRRTCRSPTAWPRRSGSATRKPTRPSTSAASTPPTSSPSSPRSPSARAIDAAAIPRRGHRADHARRSQPADELGYRIKLLGVAQRTADGIEQRVHPTMVPKPPRSRGSWASPTRSPSTPTRSGTDLRRARAPAARPTASAVVADIADIAKRRPLGAARPAGGAARTARAHADAAARGRLLHRLSVLDRPGALAAIADPHGRAQDLARKHHAAQPVAGRRARRCRSCLITYATTETRSARR